jgi:hypothetical protein
LTQVVECALDAEDVYDALKVLIDSDDAFYPKGLFKILALDENNDMEVSYIPTEIVKQMSARDKCQLEYGEDWVQYRNDYTICYVLLKYFNKL